MTAPTALRSGPTGAPAPHAHARAHLRNAHAQSSGRATVCLCAHRAHRCFPPACALVPHRYSDAKCEMYKAIQTCDVAPPPDECSYDASWVAWSSPQAHVTFRPRVW